jgi:hypothetical protein
MGQQDSLDRCTLARIGGGDRKRAAGSVFDPIHFGLAQCRRLPGTAEAAVWVHPQLPSAPRRKPQLESSHIPADIRRSYDIGGYKLTAAAGALAGFHHGSGQHA